MKNRNWMWPVLVIVGFAAVVGIGNSVTSPAAGQDSGLSGMQTFGWPLIAGATEVDCYGRNLAQVGTVDGVTVSAHKDRHDPEGGADPLDCESPRQITIVTAAAEGAAHSFARSDHVHAILHGISDNHIVTVDDADAADNDFAKFTADGLEGRSYAEVRSDINVEDGAQVDQGQKFFMAYAGALTTCGTGAWTVINFNTEDDDDQTWYDGSNKFQPDEAGWYKVGGCVTLVNLGNAKSMIVGVYKNAAIHSHFGRIVNGAAGYCSQSGSTIMYLDGDTDYAQIRCYHNHGGNLNTDAADRGRGYFWAQKIE